MLGPLAPEVVGQVVHVVQGGLDGQTTQEVPWLQLVQVKGQPGYVGPAVLLEGGKHLKNSSNGPVQNVCKQRCTVAFTVRMSVDVCVSTTLDKSSFVDLGKCRTK